MQVLRLSLTENDINISQPELVSGKGAGAVVVFVDRSDLVASAKGLCDFKRTSRAKATEMILQTFFYLTSKPELCLSPEGDDDDGANEDVGLYTNIIRSATSTVQDVPDVNVQPVQEENVEDTQSKEVISQGTKVNSRVVAPRVRVYIEKVCASDKVTVIGYRYFFFIDDERFSFGRGLESLIKENRDRKEKMERIVKKGYAHSLRTEPNELYQLIESREVYVFTMADVYRPTAKLSESGNIRKICGPNVKLSDKTNPANPCQVFDIMSLNSRMEHINNGDVCDEQFDTENYQCTLGGDDVFPYSFPVPENVYHVSIEQISPRVMYNAKFPEKDDVGVEGGLSNVIRAKFNNARADVDYSAVSDLTPLRNRNAKLLGTYDPEKHESHAEFAKKDRQLRLTLLDSFLRIWDVGAAISPQNSAMLSWARDLYDRQKEDGQVANFSVLNEACDTSLSPFGSFVARFFGKIEVLSESSVVHREIFTVFVTCFDAYSHRFGLHLNALLAGGGGAGKSFGLNKCEELLIPGTVTKVTHETSKANAVDGNMNDQIIFYHETPVALYGMDNTNNHTGDPTFKDRLTSCKYNTKMLVIDEVTGARTNRVSTSECIGVIAAATNEPLSKIPEALFSRFLSILCTTKERKYKGIIESMMADKHHNDNKLKNLFKHEMNCLQYLVNNVEKLIATNVLKDVNVELAKKIFADVLGELSLMGIDTSDPRNFERLVYFARTLTIINAIQVAFNTDSVFDFHEKEHSMEMLMELQPLLFTTEEIAYFTISMLEDMYVNPVVRPVVRAMCTIAKYLPGNSTDSTKYRVRFDGEGGTTVDHNYLHVPFGAASFGGRTRGSIIQLAHALCGLLKTISTSPENVQFVLTGLRAQRFNVTDSSNGERERMPVLELDVANSCVYLLVPYVDKVLSDGYNSCVTNAIKASFHKKSRRRKIITGRTYIDSTPCMPQFLHVIDVVPNKHRTFTVTQTVKTGDIMRRMIGDKLSNDTSNERYDGEDDMEKYFFNKHLVECGLDNTYKKCLPEAYEKKFQESNTENQLSYPDDNIKEYTRDYNRLRQRIAQDKKRSIPSDDQDSPQPGEKRTCTDN